MGLAFRIRSSLFAVIAVALATTARSVLFEKWITVFAALLMLAGAVSALRAKTWGVGLVLAASAAFPAAQLLGMAPDWFWLVGLVGASPFVLSWRPMARFDHAAAVVFAVLALAAGVTCALAWHEIGPFVIANLYP